MADSSNGRVSIYLKVAPEFKERLTAWAKAQGKSLTDAVIDELREAMKFSEFAHRPDEDRAWADLAEGRGLPGIGRQDR